MQRGADVKNLPAVLFEFFERRATNVEGAFQVDVDDGTEAVGREVLREAARKFPAAPLTTMSILLKRSTVAATAFAISSGRRTSAATGKA